MEGGVRNWNSKNMKTKIKICGLTRECEIDYVNEAKPDYVGFVFAKSRRQVGRAKAEKMKENLDARIKAVGVFVDAPIDEIISLVKAKTIDVAQLHGRESPAYVKELKKKAGCRVIKALHPEEGCQERELYDAYWEAGVDYFLFDSGGITKSRGNISNADSVQNEANVPNGRDGTTKDQAEIGGTGRAFCWDLIPDIPYPYFLAGGICIENAREAIRAASPVPYGLDISSGVETNGVKDKKKILEICAKSRAEMR